MVVQFKVQRKPLAFIDNTVAYFKMILNIFLQNFVEEILYCRESLNTYSFNLVSQKHRNLILLCVSQIQKCIPLMFKMYEMGGWTDAVTSKVRLLM